MIVLLKKRDPAKIDSGLGRPLGDLLLEPTRRLRTLALGSLAVLAGLFVVALGYYWVFELDATTGAGLHVTSSWPWPGGC